MTRACFAESRAASQQVAIGPDVYLIESSAASHRAADQRFMAWATLLERRAADGSPIVVMVRFAAQYGYSDAHARRLALECAVRRGPGESTDEAGGPWHRRHVSAGDATTESNA